MAVEPRSPIEIAREYLAQAQAWTEGDPEVEGHGLFLLGCAVKQLIDMVEELRGDGAAR